LQILSLLTTYACSSFAAAVLPTLYIFPVAPWTDCHNVQRHELKGPECLPLYMYTREYSHSLMLHSDLCLFCQSNEDAAAWTLLSLCSKAALASTSEKPMAVSCSTPSLNATIPPPVRPAGRAAGAWAPPYLCGCAAGCTIALCARSAPSRYSPSRPTGTAIQPGTCTAVAVQNHAYSAQLLSAQQHGAL